MLNGQRRHRCRKLEEKYDERNKKKRRDNEHQGVKWREQHSYLTPGVCASNGNGQ